MPKVIVFSEAKFSNVVDCCPVLPNVPGATGLVCPKTFPGDPNVLDAAPNVDDPPNAGALPNAGAPPNADAVFPNAG